MINYFIPHLNASEGIYKCGFSKGSIVHTASAELKVALLPDQITMTSTPLTVECQGTSPQSVMVNATIENSTEMYNVTWSYQAKMEPPNPITGTLYELCLELCITLFLFVLKMYKVAVNLRKMSTFFSRLASGDQLQHNSKDKLRAINITACFHSQIYKPGERD